MFVFCTNWGSTLAFPVLLYFFPPFFYRPYPTPASFFLPQLWTRKYHSRSVGLIIDQFSILSRPSFFSLMSFIHFRFFATRITRRPRFNCLVLPLLCLFLQPRTPVLLALLFLAAARERPFCPRPGPIFTFFHLSPGPATPQTSLPTISGRPPLILPSLPL